MKDEQFEVKRNNERYKEKERKIKDMKKNLTQVKRSKEN